MFEAFRDIWDFLTNGQRHWTAKLSVGGIIILTVIFCELTTGLVSLFINSQRIDQITRIENALITPGYDKLTVSYLKSAREDLIARGTFPSLSIQTFWGALVEILSDRYQSDSKLFGWEISPQMNAFLQVVSSSGVWLGLMGVVFWFRLTQENFKFNTRIFLLLVFLAAGSSALFSAIPVDNILSRLSLNLALQSIAFGILSWIISKEDVTKTQTQGDATKPAKQNK